MDLVAQIANTVSCPVCRKRIVLPEGVKARDRITCCGKEYVLTYEFGTFAGEEAK